MENKAITKCSAILGEGMNVHRCAAARALGHMPSSKSVEVLVKALLDEDPDVRTDAAASLGQIGDVSCAEALMHNLTEDPESDVKRAALKSLIDMRYAPVVPLLRALVVSRTEEIQWDEDEFYTDGWDSWLDLQLAAIHGLAAFGAEEGAPDIFTAMADEMGQDVSESGVNALAKLGELGALALEQLLESGDARLRRRIAVAIGNSDNSHVDRLRAGLLADSSARVRQISLLNLNANDPRLEAMFGDADPKVRATVVKHAGHIFPAKVVDQIVDLDPKIRAEAFKVIAAYPGLFDDEKTLDAVQKAITGEPEAAKQAALAWIALAGPDGIKGLIHTLSNDKIPLDFRVGVIEAMKVAGDICVPHLLKAAGDEARPLRLATLTSLVDFAANDPVWPNAAGVGLLAALHGELVSPPEVEAEEIVVVEADFDPGADEEEAEIDATMPLVPETKSTLDSILAGGSDVDIKEEQPVELSDQDKRFLEISKNRRMSKRKMSLESTVAPHLDVIRFSARLLGGVVNADVTAELIAALETDDSELRDALLFSLVEHGEKTGALPPEAYAPLMDILANQTSDTRVLATRALGWINDTQASDALQMLLSDPEDFIRVEAVRAFEHRGVADASVIACLKDKYLGVGIAAATAIAKNCGADCVNDLVDFAMTNDGTYRRDIGILLGTHAREAGMVRLIEVLEDENHKRNWLVAIDALAEVFQQETLDTNRKVA